MVSITIDARMLFMSGIGRYIREILNYITLDRDLSIYCLYQSSDGEEINKLPFFSRCKWIPMNSKIFSISEQLEFCMKAPKSDIFWSPQYNVPIFLPFNVKKRLTTIHDVFQFHDFKNLNLLSKLYVYMMFNYAAFKSNKIITVSTFSKNEIIKYINFTKNKVEFIYNGAELDSAPCSLDINHLPYVLMVGNVKPHKNIKSAVKAFLEISNKVEHNLVIVGKKDGFNSSDSEVFELSRNDPKIIFLGQVSDSQLITLYQNASVFLFTSLYEGFGLPLIEAMNFSLPIIASDIPVIREICGDRVNYVDPTSIKSISESLYKQLKMNKEFINYNEILSRFKWEKSAKEHLKIIKALI